MAKGCTKLLSKPTRPAHTTLATVAEQSPVQVIVAALAVPIPRPKVGVAGISAPAMLPEAITTPMHVVVPAPRATPIALQKRSPWQMALLTLHHALRMPDGFGDIMDISDVGDIMDMQSASRSAVGARAPLRNPSSVTSSSTAARRAITPGTSFVP